MSDAGDPVDDAGTTDDLGEPIAELQTLSLSVDERFGRRVRGGIERRVLAGHFLDLLWTGPLAVLIEFITIALGLARTNRKP